ncbi:MAG: sensor histidine kinase [Acidimicrobiia bacterium]|nr:sensor histidine kinase [Acidimicrobiia bacterium]
MDRSTFRWCPGRLRHGDGGTEPGLPNLLSGPESRDGFEEGHNRSWFDSATLPPVIESVRSALAEVGVEDRRLQIGIRELADNALHHSGQGEGWCQAEHLGERVAVTVQDRGIGIRRSMATRYPDIDDRSALLTAFGMGVSGAFDDPDRGLGLGLVLQYTRSGAYLLLESEGQAYIGSGGQGQVVGKSTQKVPGVTVTIFVKTPANHGKPV